MNENTNNEEQMLTNLERKVLQVIELFNRPVTVYEVSYEMGMDLQVTNETIVTLVKKDKLIKIKPTKSDTIYYTPLTSKSGIEIMINQKYVDMVQQLDVEYSEIKKEQDNLNNQIKGIYGQIITLMGIFISIFALVIINVNAISEFVNRTSTICELFKSLLVLNVPIVVSLAALILLIRFILKPLFK